MLHLPPTKRKNVVIDYDEDSDENDNTLEFEHQDQ